MDKEHYDEMLSSLEQLERAGELNNKKIYLFGHCNATEELADLLLDKKYRITAILDNNKNKQGKKYRNVLIESPEAVLLENSKAVIVCIVARAYAAMVTQLKNIGYRGEIRKLVDYNTYADYSLSGETVARMKERVDRGRANLIQINGKYSSTFKIFCPFAALGDVYIMMSYLPYFLANRGISQAVICVIGNSGRQVVELFGDYVIEVFSQKNMDELIQAALYMKDENYFIAHHDRPYVVDLHRALYVKCIPLEKIYCCGVFGLSADTKPVAPVKFLPYKNLADIPQGKAVIFSPYAKSVVALPDTVWEQIVNDYSEQGYTCFTNVTDEEEPLPGTKPISPMIAEVKSVVEWAGTFVGIRSGLCDILREVKATKIALYPDYNYCDTKWKAIDLYKLEGWKNIEVKDGFQWKNR